jgi:hypothetical protein
MNLQAAELLKSYQQVVVMVYLLAEGNQEAVAKIKAWEASHKQLWDEYAKSRDRSDQVLELMHLKLARANDEIRTVKRALENLRRVRDDNADDADKWRKHLREQERLARGAYLELRNAEADERLAMAITDTQECPNPQCAGEHLVPDRDDEFTCPHCGERFLLLFPHSEDPF